jgi:arsenate reductase-like glutaredoxin family protein
MEYDDWLLPGRRTLDFELKVRKPTLRQLLHQVHSEHLKLMKPFISNMFRMHKTLDVITLFHKPSIQASTRIATILKQASAQSQEHATEDQASDHTHQQTSRDTFELDITESPPTKDQLKSIFEYVGGSKAAQLVKGASSQSDALKKLQEDPDSFLRPVVSGNF